MLGGARSLHAQLPFYTDDINVTERGKFHVEFFNEYDALQLQYPNLAKAQLQAMAGGQDSLRKNLAICFGLLGGVYVASPRIGGQLGFSLDIP